MAALRFEEPLLEQVADRLDLRAPNREAVRSVMLATSQHYDVEDKSDTFECIVDSATGVGKTYVLAAAIEYQALRQEPARNFLILAPGRTIRDKTVQNFTPGHRKSLTTAMLSHPQLVTADNFNTASTRAAMADPNRTKVYVFTVQALTSRTGEGRATHEFSEHLGTSFYRWLSELDDLVVIADEQHCYRGKAFSATIRDLKPALVIGLTATPDTADEAKVVYRYPLAAAIADRFVKTPVLVGRKDDRSDETTKLLDGVNLLSAKAKALERHCLERGLPRVNPVMLVVASDIAEAQRLRDILDSSGFDGGRWVGRTLLVHSNLTGDEKERALADLDAVESPASNVRVIINVGMLKEGWDVKNIYVIVSMRPSVSDVLTEQTLGRGLRLPFGGYTDIEFLDTVEVLAHERYEALLKKRQALNETFVDFHTYMATRTLSDGEVVVVPRHERYDGDVLPPATPTPDPATAGSSPAPGDVGEGPKTGADGSTPDPEPVPAGGRIIDITTRTGEATDPDPIEVTTWAPLPEREPIRVPRVMSTPIPVRVSLADIADMSRFARLGRALTADIESDLIRTKVTAKRTGDKVSVGTATASDQVAAAIVLDQPLEVSERLLVERVLSVPGVERRGAEIPMAKQIVQTVIGAMGEHAAAGLSAFGERAERRLADEVTAALADTRGTAQVTYSDQVDFVSLTTARSTPKPLVHSHPSGAFERGKAYDGWSKHLYAYTWFDTRPEYEAAGAIDDSSTVVVWARLGLGDLPITWTSDGRQYNPDFVVIEDDGGRRRGWLVETKANKDMGAREVLGKRAGAIRWANVVNSLRGANATEWGYLLLSENDVYQARGSWAQMKQFGTE